MKILIADTIITNANDCMNTLYAIYMSAVESVGGDINDPNIKAKGKQYARRKFIEITKEFKKLYGWVNEMEDE